jgi:hypothetical protein
MSDLAKQVVEVLSKDEELAKKVGEANTMEEKCELLKPYIKDVTVEVLEEAANESTTGCQDISEDELDNIAGGKFNWKSALTGVVALGSTGLSIAAEISGSESVKKAAKVGNTVASYTNQLLGS